MADLSERPGLFRRLLRGGQGEERVRTARYPLQAYGKLPIYKDFISVGLTDPASKEFRQWLDRGFSRRWAVDETYRETEIPAHGFLLRLPESRAYVAGTLWGSSDEGGLRKFPFTVFLSVPAGQPAADPLSAVHYLAPFERRCDELRQGYAAGASLATFYKAYRGAEFECAVKSRESLGKELKAALGDFRLSEFAESLFGEAAASRWRELVAALTQETTRPNGVGAVRLPLGGVLPRAREIGFWLCFLQRLDPKRRRPVSGLLYAAGRGPGRAVFFFRDLAPEDFLLLHPTRRGQERVVDLAGPSEDWVPPEPTPAVEAAARPEDADTISIAAAAAPSLQAEAEPAQAAGELPFPDAAKPPEPAVFGPRETFSALVVAVAAPDVRVPGEPAAAASASAEASAPAPEETSASTEAPSDAEAMEGKPDGTASAAVSSAADVSPGWDRPLFELLGVGAASG